MSQHEVEVKPYGTKNEVETRVYTSGNRSEAEILKPPYGQKNEVTVTASAPSFLGGSRTDVEVKPFGTQDLPRESVLKPRPTTTVRNVNLEQWRNPLLATLLGITLALTLLSLSYLPRAISGLWHWGTDWMHPSAEVQKAYDAYDSVTRKYPQDMAKAREAMYEQGKNMYEQGKEQASNAYENVKDKAADLMYDAKETIKQTGENIYEKIPGSTSTMTLQAKQATCNTAQKARDMACNGVDMSSLSGSSSNMMDSARETVKDAEYKAQGIFEQAKQRAADILEHAKETISYPLHAAQDAAHRTADATGERIQSARETVLNAGEQVRDASLNAKERAETTAAETIQAAKDRIVGAGEKIQDAKDSMLDAAKDTVLGAKDTVLGAKDTVLGAGQAAKDTILEAGEAAKNMARDAIHNVKETVSGSTEKTTVTENTGTGRGPTRIKVEVQEL